MPDRGLSGAEKQLKLKRYKSSRIDLSRRKTNVYIDNFVHLSFPGFSRFVTSIKVKV